VGQRLTVKYPGLLNSLSDLVRELLRKGAPSTFGIDVLVELGDVLFADNA
jgi:hypothetical protein